MSLSCPVFLVNSFTRRPFSGNPAAVCLLDGELEDSTMRSIAAEIGFPETAFVHRDEDALSLRWFTPKVEVDLCGHATLASSLVFFERGQQGTTASYRTKSGILETWLQDGRIAMRFPRRDVVPAELPRRLSDALGLDAVVASNSFSWDDRSTFLLELESVEAVARVSPDFSDLKALGVEVIITAESRDSREEADFVSRFFAPNLGIDEDPVTGAAHCSLGPYWAAKLGVKELVGYQASARGGIVGMRVEKEHIILNGEAVILVEGTLSLP